MISTLYADDDGYICLDHTIDRNVAFTWILHSRGWEVYLGEVLVYDFDNEEVTFPTQKMFSTIEQLISHFTYIHPQGMWELSWMSGKEYCRKHLQFDEFESALAKYYELEEKGEI